MTPIYHITHITNLPLILQHGGLWCDRERGTQQLATCGIAHQHIKARRASRRVAVAAGGTLSDYVPFYFAPRSPMLYTIHRGNVEGYAGGQAQVLHLVSSVETASKLDSAWCFTDGHADMAMTEYLTDWEQRDRVDWDVMGLTYWNDTKDRPDCKRRRQAEFLVHNRFPWSAIERVGVHDPAISARVRRILAADVHSPAVEVRPEWYY